MEEYHKIKSIYERDHITKKLIEGKFADETIEFLKDNIWEFTEKVDGTNIRIIWDGHKVNFAGRTDKAQMPVELSNRLFKLFGGEANEQLFEQKFGGTPVTLYGEGYGNGIQKGGLYSQTQEFILFDVKINGNWQPRESVEDIASYFGIKVVPILVTGTLEQGVDYVKTKPLSKIAEKDYIIEGIVGRTVKELKDRKFLSDLKDLIADYNDLPFVDVLAEIEMAKHNHRWWESETDLKKELICFVHSRETKDIQRWREQYGAKALLIRRTSIEKEYGNHADDQVFELEYDYVIFNDKDLSSLEREAQTFMELIEKEKWESHI